MQKMLSADKHCCTQCKEQALNPQLLLHPEFRFSQRVSVICPSELLSHEEAKFLGINPVSYSLNIHTLYNGLNSLYSGQDMQSGLQLRTNVTINL